MANPGVGTKFVSVNLNKSYGQPSHHHHSSSYGSNRTRPGVHCSSGGGGGMVVLSRPRSSQKTVPKLSVPPPLNLPSLRKEHERFDSLGCSGGHAGGGNSGSGSRPTSSSMGWTRPGAVALQENEGHVDHGAGHDQGFQGLDGATKGGSMYTPPSARPGSTTPSSFASVEKKPVLRGEDFPSLQATLPSGLAQKQKDGQKHKYVDESFDEHRDVSRPSSNVDMRPPQLHVSHHSTSNGLNENVTESHVGSSSRRIEPAQKQGDYFSDPLPLVRLNPRSDWADDERDTSHNLMDRARDHGFLKSEAYWDRDFDMPRISVPPQKPMRNFSERWGHRDNETGKVCSSEVSKLDPYTRDFRTSSREEREGNTWKDLSLSKDGFGVQEVGKDINGFGPRPSTLSREISKENNSYTSFPFRENGHDDFRRRELGNRQRGAQPWHNSMGSYSGQGVERNTRDRFSSEQYNRHSGDASQISTVAKLPYSFNGKGWPVNEPILNLGRDKCPFSKSEKPYIEESFMKDFEANGYDSRDPFSGGLVGVVKKKKDALKQTDFHDPVRESFEAELERVQKMQEQERQRIIEEQERALEQARREEEERERLVREQEERQRRLEEEAREAAWRAEYERLETMRRAEEQRLAREEEKQRILMEEERRKHAAKQKLLELEERIAKRQAEVAKAGSSCSAGSDEKMSVAVKEEEIYKEADMGDWEDGERMVERITTSSSDSSFNRPLEMGSRPHFWGDNSSAFMERGKSDNSWRKDVFENGNSSILHMNDQDNGHHHSPRQDALGGSVVGRKEFYGGAGYISSRTYKAGIAEPRDDYGHPKGQRWNLSGDGDHYSKNMGIDRAFHDNLAENFGDVGWGMGQSHGNPYTLYPERSCPNSEVGGPYSFERSRYYTRQPRVLPPPIASMHKTAYSGEIEPSGPSPFLENEMQYNHPSRNGPAIPASYAKCHAKNLRQPEINDVQQGNTENVEQKVDSNARPRCDSQSSLSVSSPPNSPTHLSHDELDESRESSMLLAEGGSKDVSQLRQENEHVFPPIACKENTASASSSISLGDDEEWTIERNDRLQEQEEYDEYEDGFQEEDEVHEGDDENIDLTQEFDDMHLEDKGSPCMMDNLVLGFNEGVEVGMPNDDFEKGLKNEDGMFTVPQVSSSTLEERRSFDGISGDGQNSQPLDGSSKKFQETEKAVVDLVSQQSNYDQTTAVPELLDMADVSSSSGFASQNSVTSYVNQLPHSSSGHREISAIGAVPNQAEVPLKLQFGLFSGPSLIPSPIPTIQIGSIQMPLHLHPYVGHSLTPMHTSQTPLFQFGQLQYTSPVSQGVLPLAPQSMSFLQSNVSSSFSFNQNPGGTLPIQPDQESSQNLPKNEFISLPVDNQTSILSRHLYVCQGSVTKEINSLPARENDDLSGMNQQRQPDVSCIGDKRSRSESGIHAENQGYLNSAVRNYAALSRKSESHPKSRTKLSQPIIKEKESRGPKMSGTISGSKGKRCVFMMKNSGSKSSYPTPDIGRAESGGYHRGPRRNVQRTEFRVRYSADKRQPSSLVSSEHMGMDEKANFMESSAGVPTRSSPGKLNRLNMSSKQMTESECLNSDPLSSREMDSGSGTEKGAGEAALTKSRNISHSGEANLKRSICSGEDVNAPLHSGIVRVFEQPGIEAPSDEDDFIEVRSKRQMLNDRREQREKEIKTKSRVSKGPRKLQSSLKDNLATANAGKFPVSTGSETVNSIQPDFFVAEGHELINIESSKEFSTLVASQPLAPIGTPAVKSENNSDIRSQSIRSVKISSIRGISGAVKNLGQGSMFDNKNNVLDSVRTSLGSWGNSQVMTLTQNQLDEAMKFGQFDSQVNTMSISNSSMASSSILTKDKVFSSTASPISSLLAGEKIQFGAVTSPTILPPGAVTSPTILPSGSIAASHGIGLLGPCRSDVQLPHHLSGPENDCDIFEKDKCTSKSRLHLEDCEAEAAASAVAVAAISSDESGGNRLGTCSVSVSDTKSLGGADIDGITVGGAGDQQFSSRSRSEEPLSVSLPADLSVETTPISLWPPLPSPQNSSGQMLSNFPGAPPSPFPFYEMNPMLGGPVFAFGPHEESPSNNHQTLSQKSSTSTSTPVGTWQQCHSGVDSFYCPPAGFTGPFISPPSGIPGVQGPPHMVVYNHFAPIGQFGQVGLSFMGTTYIPSGKQPDWKHTSASSAMGVGEGKMNNLNMISTRRNPIQHMAPGSPLLPMASPLATFDVSPFQSSADMTVQAHWSHLPTSPLSSMPKSMPLQQADGVLSSKFGHGSIDQSLTANRFPNSQSCADPGKNRNYPLLSDATITQLPDELGLVDPSSSRRSTSASMIVDSDETDARQSGGSSNISSHNSNSNSKNQSSHPKKYNLSSGYNYQRTGGASQKNCFGGEWAHHRRTGSHGRNQSSGAERSYHSSKVKQIYVAKQTSTGTSAT